MSAPRSRAPRFAARVVAWQQDLGRRDLPWQGTRDPYRVWLAEVMLQQTQVATVIPYYRRFCARFADVQALAQAPIDDVLALWAGLGYYARARHLHACAREIVQQSGGSFPGSAVALGRLPGIGRSTAAAIAAFCFNERAPILDGNVKRVLTRYFGIDGFPGATAVERALWSLAESLLPKSDDMPAYTQGLMDLGATLCTRRAPDCDRCPLRRGCRAHRDGRVDELPAARPRKTPLQRQGWALLALHAGRVLLQRRGATGLWGGLLALPQFDSIELLQTAADALDGTVQLQPLAPRAHAFTHFTLTMRPYRLDLLRLPATLREDDQVWLPLADIESAPLPTPVRTLLRTLTTKPASLSASTQ